MLGETDKVTTSGRDLLKNLHFILQALGSYCRSSHRGETRSEFHCKNRPPLAKKQILERNKTGGRKSVRTPLQFIGWGKPGVRSQTDLSPHPSPTISLCN